MKKIVVGLFLSLVSTIVFVSFLELASRQANKTVFEDRISSADLRSKFEQAYIPPFPEKDQNRLRVFVYGGSTIQGLPLEKIGIVSQLDYQLHQVLGEKRDLEIYNLGWSGYNSTMVRYIVQQTIGYKPDLMVIYTGHNEFIYPQIDSYELIKAQTWLKNKSGFEKLILALKQKNIQESNSLDEKVDKKRPAFRKEAIFYPLKMLIFRQNMKAIAGLSQKYNIPVIFCTPVSNVAQWPPADRKATNIKTPQDYRESLQKAKNLIKDNQLVQALQFLASVEKKYPNDAPLIFLQAQTASQSGQIQARDLFIQAKDWDLIPWRTTSNQNNFIRSLSDNKTVFVADTEKILSQESPNQLSGFDYIIDNVHPTMQGSHKIVKVIIDLLKEKKPVKPDWWQENQPYMSLDEFLKRVKYSDEDELELNFSTAKYCMKNPFFNYSAAENYLEKAEAVEENWRTKALHASLAFLQNNPDSAKIYLKQAETLNELPLSQDQIQQIPYLNQFINNR